MLITSSAKDLIPLFQQGGVFAYPTESVYGLGCDPNNEDAVMRLLGIKKRPIRKGLILLATDFSQVHQYLANDIENLFPRSYQRLLASSNTTFTHLVNDTAPKWLIGEFDSLAIRISQHPEVMQLCNAFGSAIVSTSANFSGQSPARTFDEVVKVFGVSANKLVNPSTCLDAIFKGTTGSLLKPTAIRNGNNGDYLRR